MSSPSVCPCCGKTLPLADAAFCPYCGAATRVQAAVGTPEEARRMLAEAEKQRDPKKKHEIYLEAQKRFPDCLEVAEAILYLGRLYERDSRRPDYSVIKSYLWHMYLTPEEFGEATKKAMRTELFEHPDLKRCLELAPDADAFLRGYLERLAMEFVRIFLSSSSHYMPSFFGIRFDGRTAKVLAAPVARMLSNIRKDFSLPPERRAMLAAALYQGFLKQTGGDSHWLDEKLAQMGQSAPGRSEA